MFATAFRMTGFLLALTLLTGVIYPLLTTGIARILFPQRSGGSLVMIDGKVIGSRLIAQKFTGERYFHPRPSAVEYAGESSGASNLGVTSAALNDEFARRISSLHKEGGKGAIPDDLVTASGSGLDPHITPQAVRYQAPRVARARGLGLADVTALIDANIEEPTFGLLGMPRVNVLMLNLELDRLAKQ